MSFAIYKNGHLACERTNERHDLLIEQIRKNEIEMANTQRGRGRQVLAEKHKITEKGLKSPCLLRKLSKFDFGYSFLVDSLHNIYLGLFVSAIPL